MRLFEVNGQIIAARSFNPEKSTPPLICIHGITSSVNFWTEGQTPYIQENWQWHSLSLPGHYPAQFPAGFSDFTAENLVKTVWAAIHEMVGKQKVILVGHSTGGFLALALTASAPEQVLGIISISGFVRGKWTGALAPFQRFARMGAVGKMLFKAGMKLTFLNRTVYRLALGSYAVDKKSLYAHPAIEATIDLIYPDAKRLDLDAMYLYFRHMPDIDITDWLKNIHVPTLVVAGSRDPIVPPSQAQLIAHHVPQAELVLLDGVGHLPMAERSQLYHETVIRWLKTLV